MIEPSKAYRLSGFVARSVLGRVTISTGTHVFEASDVHPHLKPGSCVSFLTRDGKTAENITLIGMTDLHGNTVRPGRLTTMNGHKHG